MKKIKEMKENAKTFVEEHAIECIVGLFGISTFAIGWYAGSEIRHAVDWKLVKNGVKIATERGVIAGIDEQSAWIRENIPDAHRSIMKFIKENPDKYNIKDQLMRNANIVDIGKTIGTTIDFSSIGKGE